MMELMSNWDVLVALSIVQYPLIAPEYRQVKKFSIKPIACSVNDTGEVICTSAEEIVDIDGELKGKFYGNS